jgi:hypothetical protein
LAGFQNPKIGKKEAFGVDCGLPHQHRTTTKGALHDSGYHANRPN